MPREKKSEWNQYGKSSMDRKADGAALRSKLLSLKNRTAAVLMSKLRSTPKKKVCRVVSSTQFIF